MGNAVTGGWLRGQVMMELTSVTTLPIMSDKRRVSDTIREQEGIMNSLAKIEEGGVPADRRERMQRQARASRAPNTWKSYTSDWKVWTLWAERNGAQAMPADPEAVAAFLSDMSVSRKRSTLQRYLSSIGVTHQLRGLAFNRRHVALKTILQGIAREKPEAPRRVLALTADRLRSMVKSMGEDLASLRDAAILLIGVASGCRRSELASLDWQKHGDGLGVIELTDAGATIRLLRAKEAQTEPTMIYIQPGMALAALKRWTAAAGIMEASAVFRPIGKGGKLSSQRLGDRTIARIVKSRCEAAGLDPESYSGHSLRSGMITSAAEAGVPQWQIAQHSRHKSDAVLRTYIRPVERQKNAVNGAIGL